MVVLSDSDSENDNHFSPEDTKMNTEPESSSAPERDQLASDNLPSSSRESKANNEEQDRRDAENEGDVIMEEICINDESHHLADESHTRSENLSDEESEIRTESEFDDDAPPHDSHLENPEFVELLDLLDQVEDYIPTVPDALSLRYLEEAGFQTVDPRITRLMSIAAQKFISEITNDALQHCKTRTINSQHSSGHNSNKDKKPNKDKKYTLTVEDLQPALAENGITVRKPQYFV